MFYFRKDHVKNWNNCTISGLIFPFSDKESRQLYGEQLVHMPTYECICLLTTFSNMARARRSEGVLFVQVVVSEIYEVFSGD